MEKYFILVICLASIGFFCAGLLWGLKFRKPTFTAEEKYLIKRALDDRIETLHKHRIMDKDADYENTGNDIDDLLRIGSKFFSNRNLWS